MTHARMSNDVGSLGANFLGVRTVGEDRFVGAIAVDDRVAGEQVSHLWSRFVGEEVRESVLQHLDQLVGVLVKGWLCDHGLADEIGRIGLDIKGQRDNVLGWFEPHNGEGRADLGLVIGGVEVEVDVVVVQRWENVEFDGEPIVAVALDTEMHDAIGILAQQLIAEVSGGVEETREVNGLKDRIAFGQTGRVDDGVDGIQSEIASTEGQHLLENLKARRGEFSIRVRHAQILRH